MPSRIHIFGASGTGTTSLASALAARHVHRNVDTADFYWLRTDPPYRHPRPRAERLAMLRIALAESASWVLSGSLCGWGDPLVPEFELVVFLVVSTDVRLARLRARELQRYGEEAIVAGGKLHQTHPEILDWAGRYDTGGVEMPRPALHATLLGQPPRAGSPLEGQLAGGPPT